MEVKFKFLRSMIYVSLEEKFSMKSLLDRFSLSSKNQTKVKKEIINLFSTLKDSE